MLGNEKGEQIVNIFFLLKEREKETPQTVVLQWRNHRAKMTDEAAKSVIV
jgi:hypothetical protein